MSFLDSTSSAILSSRITKHGRKAIADGNFVISYFQVGDSEYDYNSPFDTLNGVAGVPSQKVFAPFDMQNGIKYPYKLENTTGSTTYGEPVKNSRTVKLKNAMGAAGYVSSFISYTGSGDDTTVECTSQTINKSQISGSTSITVSTGSTFSNCGYITLVFGDLGGTDPEVPTIVKNINSLIYKIVSISGNTLNLDRATPDLSSLSGTAKVICNYCENENYDGLSNINYQGQLNPWSLNLVWSEKPIGADVAGLDENLTGYTSNMYVSTKEYFGYTTDSAQTFVNSSGETITKPTSFVNSFNELIEVKPSEQRCVAIVHYSELGDPTSDTERFYKYDDYISYDDSKTNTIAIDEFGLNVSDSYYFQVYLPFCYYHRNTGNTYGAVFYMDENDNYYVKSTKDNIQETFYRYLLDEQGNSVGKIFAHNKTIVFDDQELVAMLDYRSNRRFTLPSPKVFTIPSNVEASSSLLSGSTDQVVWITYMLANSTDQQLNSLPCNYFNKVYLEGSYLTPSQVGVRFNTNAFRFMKTNVSGVTSGYTADEFYILLQVTSTGVTPSPDLWKIIDITNEISGHTAGSGNFINPDNIENYTFTITKSQYDSASFFDLEDYMSDANYLGDETFTTEPQFGDEQPFPGSIRLVRSTDIEELNFSVTLQSSQFTTSQNPTYHSGATKKITEVALLNENGETLLISKIPKPITRTGSQTFTVRLDF